MPSRSTLLFVVLVLSQWPAYASPSFDCSAVESGSSEALICADPELSELDVELARLYEKVLAAADEDGQRSLEATQSGWMAGRNESWKQSDPRAYVLDEYRRRIAVLSVMAGEVTVPAPVDYDCTGGEFTRLTATFYPTEPPVGVFTRTPEGDWAQFIANGWDDAGAIHYNIGGLDFIDRDGQAELNWAGTPMSCTRRD
jgi:uncharacterized protein